jgi:hypothetical protein
MHETMAALKERARKWPGEWGEQARELCSDEERDLVIWPKFIKQIVEDLRQSLTALEEEMIEEESKTVLE